MIPIDRHQWRMNGVTKQSTAWTWLTFTSCQMPLDCDWMVKPNLSRSTISEYAEWNVWKRFLFIFSFTLKQLVHGLHIKVVVLSRWTVCLFFYCDLKHTEDVSLKPRASAGFYWICFFLKWTNCSSYSCDILKTFDSPVKRSIKHLS